MADAAAAERARPAYAWDVFDLSSGRNLGFVRAPLKGWAAAIAERDLKVRPGSYRLVRCALDAEAQA